CYNTLGVLYAMASDFSTSMDYHKKAIEVRTHLKDTIGLMKSYNNLGTVLKELGDYKTEADYYFRALKMAEGAHDSLSQARILTNIADVFKRQEQYGKSEQYHLRSLALRKKLNDPKGMVACYIGLAILKQYGKLYPEAEAYYKQAEALLEKHADNFLLGKFYGNYGSLVMDMGRYDEAQEMISVSVAANTAIGNENGNLMNYFNLATIYHHLQQLKKANEAYQKSLDLSIRLGNKLRQQESYLGLSNTYAGLNNYEAAFDARLKYEALRDSLHSLEAKRQLAETETRYRVEKKDAEIRLLHEKNRNAELRVRQRTLVIGALLILMLLAVVAGYFMRGRRRLRRKLETERLVWDTEENERLRIAKDIHDELGSGLSKIKFLAELAGTGDKGENSAIHSISDTSKHLVENMRDLIWAMNPENTALDHLVARIREYASDYLEEFPVELTIDAPANVQALPITKEASRNILMIVKEALQNSMKHARATEIGLKLKVGKELRLQITDNGQGFDPQQDKSGNGLRNMKSRMSAIGGQLTLVSQAGKGSSVELNVPLTAIEKPKILL
ncbi:MAG: tetratricopeptide repeat-containing sensor histidine kinase, partial [Bacteroidia bacterium]